MKLIMKDCRFECYLGQTSEERSSKQEVFVDVELALKDSPTTDDVRDAVDYDQVYSLLEDILQGEHHLLETVVRDMVKKIMEKFSLASVRVALKKPGALPGSAYVICEEHA